MIQDVEVRGNLQDGVGIMYTDQYAIANPEARVFRTCSFTRNGRHGVSLRQLGINMTGKSESMCVCMLTWALVTVLCFVFVLFFYYVLQEIKLFTVLRVFCYSLLYELSVLLDLCSVKNC